MEKDWEELLGDGYRAAERLTEAIGDKSGLSGIYHYTSQTETSIRYGHAYVILPGFRSYARAVPKRARMRKEGEEERVVDPQQMTAAEFVSLAAEVLKTGRTKEVGRGVGLRDLGWEVRGAPINYPWRHLLSVFSGEQSSDRPWVLNPDYQRGPVWSEEQQTKFIGHVLTGGQVPLIYLQRYDGPENAPPEHKDNYFDCPAEVIDGQQRLRAILRFLRHEIPGRCWVQGQWRDVWYRDFNEIEQGDHRLDSQVVFVDLPRQKLLEFYLKLNSGIAHTEADLERVRQMIAEEAKKEQ